MAKRFIYNIMLMQNKDQHVDAFFIFQVYCK